ncbi:MAG: ATP-binding protein, partial [Rhizobium sp.]
MSQIPIVMSWSGGKDCYLALNRLRHDPQYEVVELASSFCRETGCVGIHEVRRDLIRQQATSLGLPLAEVELPAGASNQVYEAVWHQHYSRLLASGVTHVGFGDLFLEDIRAYREQFLARLGLTAVFPLWGRSTRELAYEAIASGMRAVLCSCDAQRLGAAFVGRIFDQQLLKDLPPGCDPCGENGEFHTFVFDGPGFSQPIPWQPGEVCRRGSVDFCDLLPVQHR